MSKKSKYKSLDELIPHTQQIPWKEERDENVTEKFNKKIEIIPVTENHKKYLKLIEEKQITIVDGPAGSGKTNYAAGYGIKSLKEGKIKNIIITRPMVACGKTLGFFPGNELEKAHPYMIPILEAFEYYISKQEIDNYIAKEIIRIKPLELMRGLSISNSLVILDEAQNCEYEQLHMFITRLGTNSKFIINSDIHQTDLKEKSDLAEIIKRLYGMNEIGFLEFNENDILRNPLLKEIGKRLDKGRNPGYNNKDVVKVLHTETESWYQEKCKYCKKVCWVNNGDENDSTLQDYDGFSCWGCKKHNLLNSNSDPFIGISYERPKI